MKKFFAIFLLFSLLFTAACGKPPQPSEPPTEPSQPVTQAPTEAPTEEPTQPPTEPVTEPVTELPTEAPEEPPTEVPIEPDEPATEPEQSAVAEPDGFVAVSMLQGNIPDLKSANHILPLSEQVSVVLGEVRDGWQLIAYDHRASKVLSRLDVEYYESAGALALLETAPYALLYQDGRHDWKVTVGDDWQMTREKTDIRVLHSQMGSHTVETPKGGITLDGKPIPALQAGDRLSYAFVRVLNDQQLLYYATDRSIPGLSHYGVYDHTTGETRAVTTMGQQVIGTWGENLLVGLWAENGWYNLGLIRLEDMSYTKLDVDCDVPQKAVAGMELDREGTRLITVRPEENGRVVRVYAVPECQLLYQWTVPDDGVWDWRLVAENGIVFWKKQSGGITVWTVEY